MCTQPVAVRIRRLPGRPLDPLLQRLRRGTGDLTHRKTGSSWFRATRTPDGPALVHLDETTVATAWGPGADWALDHVPALLGDHDDPTGFSPAHPVLKETQRRHPYLRIGRTEAVWEAFVPAVIEQKVTAREAFAGYRQLLQRYGNPAPGPGQKPGHKAYGMICPPSPQVWARIPSWEWRKAGIDHARSATIVAAAHRAAALERTLHSSSSHVDRGLQSLPGVGLWTSAEVRQRAHGDPDAWSDGDYHLPGAITLALTGEVLDNDAAKHLLEPYRGHRYRVQQLITLSGIRPPRRGPRRTLPIHLPR